MKKHFGKLALSTLLISSLLMCGCEGETENEPNSVFSPEKETQSTSETKDSNEEENNGALQSGDASYLSDGGDHLKGANYRDDSWFPFDAILYDFEDEDATGRLFPVADTLNVEEVYASIDYQPYHFYGNYILSHPDKTSKWEPTKEFTESHEWVDYNSLFANLNDVFYNGGQVIPLPFKFLAGTTDVNTGICADKSHDWCEVFYPYISDYGYESYCNFYAAYTVSGNTITLQFVKDYDPDYNNDTINYTLSDITISYEFAFKGPELTLSYNGESASLLSDQFIIDEKESNYLSYYVKNYEGEEKIDDICEMTLTLDLSKDPDCYFYVSTPSANGYTDICYDSAVRISDNGLVDFSYTDTSGEIHSHQFVVFFMNYSGLILTDGTNEYRYFSSSFKYDEEYYSNFSINNIREEDQQAYQALTPFQQQELEEIRTDLLDDLSLEFSSQGIDATINPETGEIVFDSEILFDVNEYTLSDEGKEKISKFILSMSSVLDDEKYDDFIAEIEIQGHTDTNGDYDMNMELSQNRANTVCDFCLEELSNDTKNHEKFSELLNPVGYSYDHPVYAADGNVDLKKSRRVVFVFYINLSSL